LQNLLRVVIGLFGLLFVVMAIGFVLDPARAAANLGVGPISPLGLATLRGDFLGFFGGSGALSIIGAVRNDSRFLTAPLLIVALTLTGRLVTIVVSGFDPAMAVPMIVEALLVLALGLGWRSLARS